MMLAGCAQMQPAIQAPAAAPQSTALPAIPSGIRRPGWLSPAARVPGSSGPVVYLASVTDDGVLIYPETGGQPIGEISNGVNSPYGLYVDKYGTLYVANWDNTVTAYAAGSTSPSTTWSQDLDRPLYPIVDSSGDLFVSNANNGTVVEYLSGSTNAYQVLHTPGKEADGMDFDSQGNLYVAYRLNDKKRAGAIEEFGPGSTQGKVLPMKINEPQGLIVDNSGNIVVVVTGAADRIELFRPGHRYYSQEIPAPKGSFLTQIALEADESELYADEYNGSVLSVAYPFPPSATLSELFRADSLIQGMAISNGQTF